MWNTLWIGTVSEAESMFEGLHDPQLASGQSFGRGIDLRNVRSGARGAVLGMVQNVRALADWAEPYIALQKEQAYAPSALWLDAVMILTASVLAAMALPSNVAHFPLVVGNGLLIAMVFCGISRIWALNAPFQPSSPAERIRAAIAAWCAAFATATLLMVLIAPGALLFDERPLFFVLGGAAAVLSRFGSPIVMRRRLRRRSLSGQNHIVIWPAGDESAKDALSELEQVAGQSVRKIPYDHAVRAADWSDILDDLATRVRSMSCILGPGDIFVVAGNVAPSRLSDVLNRLAAIPRTVLVVPDRSAMKYLRLRSAAIGSLPTIEVRRVRHDLAQMRLKRAVDVILSLVALLLLLPLFAVVAAAIRVETRGPVFFRQSRTGYRGQTFRIFKFRTMCVLEDGPTLAQATKGDPRVTRVGSILRRSSLDELPQLLNVLAGDMSLVGPRPHALAHDRFYDQRIRDYALRQHVLPGITGWAQIHGLRGETSTVDAMRRRIEHDLWYATNGRLLLDIWIMMRTCVEIFRCRNAY